MLLKYCNSMFVLSSICRNVVPNGDYRNYDDHTSIETVGPPSDGSVDLSVQQQIDLSVQSGNVDLGRYLKKKSTTNSGTACKNELDLEMRANSSISVSQTITTVSTGLSGGGPVHLHATTGPAPLSQHMRIQSQLYPTTIHSSLKYKVSPHTSHMHRHQHNLSPPRYSSPPPLPCPPPANPYEFSDRIGNLLSNNSYSHTPSPSIDSVYPRTQSHNHNHTSPTTSFEYQHGLTSQQEYIQLPYVEGSGTIKKEPARIRIPSNPSVTSRSSIGRISSSSIEHLSEHGSPMPNFHVEILSPGRAGTAVGSRSSVNEYAWPSGSSSKFKPAPDELRR